jgi:hypothetical protein
MKTADKEAQKSTKQLRDDARDAERGWICCFEHPNTHVICHRYHRSNRPTTAPLQCRRCSHPTVWIDQDRNVQSCPRCFKVALFRNGVDTVKILSEIPDTAAHLAPNELWSYVCLECETWGVCRCTGQRDQNYWRRALRIL